MMSYGKIPKGLVTHEKLSVTDRLVLVYLMCVAGVKKECFPSYGHIAKELKVSRWSVIRAVDRLSELGLISIQCRKNQKGGTISNLYKIAEDTYCL